MGSYKFIGFGGVAGSGKNFWAEELKKELEKHGKKVALVGFATALKKGLDSLLQKYLGISAFTEDPKEKSIIRPHLIAEGMHKRNLSNGRYWADIVFGQDYPLDREWWDWKKNDNNKADYVLITDYRFNKYPNDEGQQILNNGGKIVYVERLDKAGNPIAPVIPEEIINDPYVRESAHYILTAQDLSFGIISIGEKESQIQFHIEKILEILGEK